ncbi:hypothetical protein JNB62_05430 [Microbacterium jejuense]|uniref:Uncharacterized protein n=1 Tax=Microbacterium jejuense TaxID=1263637 RepID=A0ABS7HLL4_9MICO|nr:hypothetical protein [Microbacterium jejuense]MBW9093117.1 hypothetical protein [Microbacterium jejuense]
MTIDNPIPEDGGKRDWVRALGHGLLGELPGGSTAAAMLAQAVQSKQSERFLDWAAMTNARLAALEAAGIHVDAQDPEFVALFTRLHRAASETADEEKRHILSQAAANSGSWSQVPYDLRAEYAAVVADLLPIHIRTLAAMERAMQRDAATGDYLVAIASFPWLAEQIGLPEIDARRITDYLEQRDLGQSGDNGGAMRPRLTPFGQGLLDYVRAPR